MMKIFLSVSVRGVFGSPVAVFMLSFTVTGPHHVMLEHLWLTIAVYCLPCVFLLHWLESHNKLAAKAFSGRWNGQRCPERLLEKARVCQEKSSVLLSLNMESWEDIQLEI